MDINVGTVINIGNDIDFCVVIGTSVGNGINICIVNKLYLQKYSKKHTGLINYIDFVGIF